MKDYERRLNALLDEIFAASDRLGLSVPQMAAGSGLAYSTVWRLNARETKLPRLKTVMALADLCGMDLTLVARRAGRRVA